MKEKNTKDKVDKFNLTTAIAIRARQLVEGSPKLIEDEEIENPIEIAKKEIELGLIKIDKKKNKEINEEELINEMDKYLDNELLKEKDEKDEKKTKKDLKKGKNKSLAA